MTEHVVGSIQEIENNTERLGSSCTEVYTAMTDRQGMEKLTGLRTLVSFEQKIAAGTIVPDKGETPLCLSLMSPDSRTVLESLMPDHVHFVLGETFSPQTEALFIEYLSAIAADEVSRGKVDITEVDEERRRQHNGVAEAFLDDFKTHCEQQGDRITTKDVVWQNDKSSMIEPFARACIRLYAHSAEARQIIEAEATELRSQR